MTARARRSEPYQAHTHTSRPRPAHDTASHAPSPIRPASSPTTVTMQIIWALLDGVTIIVLGSGLYLWWARRGPKRSDDRIEAVMAEAGLAR